MKSLTVPVLQAFLHFIQWRCILLGDKAHLSCNAKIGDTNQNNFLKHGIAAHLVEDRGIKGDVLLFLLLLVQFISAQKGKLHHVLNVEAKDPVLFLFDYAEGAPDDVGALTPAQTFNFLQAIKRYLKSFDFEGVKSLLFPFCNISFELFHDGD